VLSDEIGGGICRSSQILKYELVADKKLIDLIEGRWRRRWPQPTEKNKKIRKIHLKLKSRRIRREEKRAQNSRGNLKFRVRVANWRKLG